MIKAKKVNNTNILLTIILILGCVTVLFPLYMAIMIAFKNPSEMTNDVAGALGFPSHWSFANFKEAMRITLIVHSMAGYAIGRSMARKKSFKFAYFYIVSGMFVPFAILMMPLVKETAQLGIDNRLGVILLYVVFYMPMNVMLYSGYLKNVPLAMEEAADIDGASAWRTYWTIIFPTQLSQCLQHSAHGTML